MYLTGDQLSYTGHVVNFPQEIQQFVNDLLRKVFDVEVIIVRRSNPSGDHRDFRVRRGAVSSALLWLKENNMWYQNITVNKANLLALPVDDYIDNALPHVLDDPDIIPGTEVVHPSGEDMLRVIESVVCPPMGEVQHDVAVAKHDDAMLIPDVEATEWPQMGAAINEYNTQSYIVMGFPKLFPTGAADLRAGRQRKVNFPEYFCHLMKYHGARFAQHSRFRYFAHNSQARWTAQTTGSAYLKYLSPEDEALTFEQLAEQYLKTRRAC